MGVYSPYPSAYIRHEETGGEAVVSAESVSYYEQLGWRQYKMPHHLDPDAPDAGVHVQPDLEEEEPEPILSADEVEALKGKALDEALEAAGLPKTGSADEKRARLAEYEAELANTTTKGDEE